MMLTTSPRVTSRSTPFSTRLVSKDLVRPRMRTTASPLRPLAVVLTCSLPDIDETRFEISAGARQAVVDGEVDDGANDVERHRLVDAADHLLGRQHRIDDADEGDQGAALHH